MKLILLKVNMKSNVMCGIAFLRTVWGCAFVGISACRNVRKCCIVSGLIADYCWLNWLVSTFGTITRLKGNYITKILFLPFPCLPPKRGIQPKPQAKNGLS